MGFKSVEQYTEDRYHDMFRLVNDGESADVIILYRSKADMLVGNVHYIKSDDYSGYVHCLDRGCPICAVKRDDGSQKIRVQSKTFIPIYNISKNKVEFWDRNYNNGFVAQLDRDIFSKYPNPSEYVFKVTRVGAFNDRNTRYTFRAMGTNSVMSYDQILAQFQLQMPDCYESVVRSCSFAELTDMMQSQTYSAPTTDMPAYVPVPRAGYQSSIPDTFVSAADAMGSVPTEAPMTDTDIVTDIANDPILSQFDDVEPDGGEFPDPDF